MTDSADWYSKWEAQQTWYLPQREPRFNVMLDALEIHLGDAPAVIADLGCGPGSLAVRVLDRLPNAQVLAIDNDPVLLQLGRDVHGDRDGRLIWVEASLADSKWIAEFGTADGSLDAAVSTTALHWLGSSGIADLCIDLATAIRVGGLFLDGDNLGSGRRHGPIGQLVAGLTSRNSNVEPGADPWGDWWLGILADPRFAASGSRRQLLPSRNGHDDDSPWRGFYEAALVDAGFSDTGGLWQVGDDIVLAAVR